SLLRLRDEAEKAVMERRIEKYITVNKDFHFYIYNRCNNKWLVRYIQSLWYFGRWVNVATLFEHNVAQKYLASHGRIYEAIRDRDEKALEAAFVDHLNDALESTLRALSRLEK
ncbi:unnamed protein product, partial [marine sediment metagenome]